MKVLKLPVEEAVIEKTGLPFYDAARLIGAAHLLFGTATAEAEDRGTRWVLRGPKLAQGRHPRQLLWVLREMLPSQAPSKESGKKKQPGKKQAGFARVEEWVLSRSHLNDREQSKTTRTKAYDFLDAAFQSGIRGFDPLRSYGKLASASSSADLVEDSEFNVYSAIVGASFAAIATMVDQRGRRPEGERRLLPILEGGHLLLGPFLDFRRSYQHEAGSFVAVVWASLALIEELVGRHDLPVSDFAYNLVVPRVQSSSGYLGVDRVCRLMRRYKEEGREFHYVRQVRAYLAGTSWQGTAAEHDLARALAHFSTTAEVKHLESVVRLNARLMAQEEAWPRQRAQRLFAGREVLQEVKEMTGQDVDVPWGLTRALAEWFTSGGSKGWIGNFIKLENASSADRFFAEVERILSRARMDSQAPVQYNPPREEQAKLQQAKGQEGSEFRAYKALFFLDVLSRLSTGGRSRTDAQDTVEQPEEVTNE